MSFTGADDPAVPDRLTVRVGADAAVLVCSDLHLEQSPTPATALMAGDLVSRLAAWAGPGVVVCNGDTFELWAEADGTVDGALDAHPGLAAALREFAGQPGREVVFVVGNHDAPIAWDRVSARTLAGRLHARCALSADLVFATPAGDRVVRCEHGHAFDPANRFTDPRNPLDSPLGQHIVQEVLPEVRRTPLLADVSSLADPSAVGRFLASRLVYRQLGPRLWWLLAPILLTVLLHTPAMVWILAHPGEAARLERWAAFTSVTVLAETALLLMLCGLAARSVYGAMAASRFGPRGVRLNAVPRAAAAALCAGTGDLAGLITGHTHQPELGPAGRGFYANTGGGTRQVEARRARLLLPPVFLAVLRRSWVEIDVRDTLRVRLVVAETPAGDATRLERLLVRAAAVKPRGPRVVATLRPRADAAQAEGEPTATTSRAS